MLPPVAKVHRQHCNSTEQQHAAFVNVAANAAHCNLYTQVCCLSIVGCRATFSAMPASLDRRNVVVQGLN